MKKEELCLKTLDEIDWSAASDIFQVCIASLKDDPAKVAEMLPRLASSGDVTKTSFREWPVFDWVRNDDQVLRIFKETFGEPASKDQTGGEVVSEEDPVTLASEQTVH